MTVEHKQDGKTECTACPYCGDSLEQYQGLAKHIRFGHCSGSP